MDLSFSINTPEGDELIIALRSSYNFINEILGTEFKNLEVIDMSIIRKNGHNSISSRILTEIVSRTSDIINSSPNAVLFYLCDSSDDIPAIRPTRNILPQVYRDRLFNILFRRYCKKGADGWFDYRIEASIDGAPQYAHLIYRSKHRTMISKIAEEAEEIFEIMDIEKRRTD